MPPIIAMPALSPTMSEGTVARWCKKEGEEVKSGDLLAEIETDKAVMELEADEEGVLARILVAEGAGAVAVGAPIALLLTEGEDSTALEGALDGADNAQQTQESTEPPAPTNKTKTNTAQRAGAPRLRASPLARKLAEQAGLALADIRASGPNGRVIAEDVRRAAASALSQSGKSSGSPPQAARAANQAVDPFSPLALAQALERAHRLTPLSAIRRTIATRLTESKKRIPHYYLNANCRLDALIHLRAQINEAAQGAYKLSINDFIVRALALALSEVPQANCAFDEQGLVYWECVDISIAVATEDGLFTPIVRDADRLSLIELSAVIKELAHKARTGRLQPSEYLGGSFSLSNLGMFGVSDFSAVINPPQSGILAVGAAETSVFVGDHGTFEAGQKLRLTLSLDHRAVDGAIGAALLARIRETLERPLLLAIDRPLESAAEAANHAP